MGLLTRQRSSEAAPQSESLPSDVFTLSEDANAEQIEWVARFERERGKQAYARAEQLEGWAAQVRGRS